jgi:RNA polymerase sigma-70 factor (ECF subfamily)
LHASEARVQGIQAETSPVTDGSVERDESGLTSESLLARVKTRDHLAWERLVQLYSPLVYRWCRHAGLQAADAADIGQEVFQAVARCIADYRHSRPQDTFRGWLCTITRNKIRDFIRQRPAERTVSEIEQLLRLPAAGTSADATPPPRDQAEAIEARIVYVQALRLIRGQFEWRTWRAFWQVAVEGARPTDVASELEMSLNAVYLAKSRVLHRLREEFGDFIEPELL